MTISSFRLSFFTEFCSEEVCLFCSYLFIYFIFYFLNFFPADPCKLLLIIKYLFYPGDGTSKNNLSHLYPRANPSQECAAQLLQFIYLASIHPTFHQRLPLLPMRRRLWISSIRRRRYSHLFLPEALHYLYEVSLLLVRTG